MLRYFIIQDLLYNNIYYLFTIATSIYIMLYYYAERQIMFM